MPEHRVVPLLFSPPRLWIWPTLSTALALILCWSLLPHARGLWQAEPARPRQPLDATAQRIWPGQTELRLPLRASCPGPLRARLGSGQALALRSEAGPDGPMVRVRLPGDLPAGLHLLRVRGEGCRGDTGGSAESATPLLVLPPALPAPRLLVASRGGVLHAQLQGAPGALAELRLVPSAGEPAPPPVSAPGAIAAPAPGEEAGLLVALLPLPPGGVAGVDLPLPMELAPRLRARLVAPRREPVQDPALAPALRGRDPSPSPPCEPPLLVPAAALAPEGPVGVLGAQLNAGARASRFSWDVLLPDSYLPALPGWRALAQDGGPRVELALGLDAHGPVEPIACLLRDATVARVGSATRIRGQCPLRVTEALRTRLFHSGTRLLVRLPADGVDLPPLPVALDVWAGEGAVIEEAVPPPRVRPDPPPRTGEAGSYVRLARRTLFPLVDVPEPTALLLYPVRRLAQHALRLIGLTLKLLPLMILLPLIWPGGAPPRRLWMPRGLPLLLLLGAAAAPLTWTGWLGARPGLPSDLRQIAAALLWELAALSWVFASVRSRGLLRSALHTLVLLGLVVLPVLIIHYLWRRTGTPVVDRGEVVSLLLSGALVALVQAGCWQMGQEAGLTRAQQGALAATTLGLFLSGGFSQSDFYADTVALRLAGLAPLLVVLLVVAALRPGASPAPGDPAAAAQRPAAPAAAGGPDERLLWPLFLAAVPPLVMDHGLPLGVLCALVVYRVWSPQLRAPFLPPPDRAQLHQEAPEADPVPDEAEAVLVALEEHPLLLLQRDREALHAAARRGGLTPEGYRLGLQALTEREVELAEQGYTRAFRQLPDVLSLGTAEGPLRDGWRGLKVTVAPMMLYLLFLLLVAEPFDPQRLLRQMAESLRLVVQLLALGFFFGYAFSALPGRNGLIKALFATLLTMACELPAGVMTWYRGEDIVRGLVHWVGVLGILGWVGLWGFDLHRLRLARRGVLDLRRVRGYSRGFALTTSIILGIFTTVVSGLTGKLGAILQSAVATPPGITAREGQGPIGAADVEAGGAEAGDGRGEGPAGRP